jgi:hypothetical protein
VDLGEAEGGETEGSLGMVGGTEAADAERTMGLRLILIMRGGGWRVVLLVSSGGDTGIAEGPGRGPDVAWPRDRGCSSSTSGSWSWASSSSMGERRSSEPILVMRLSAPAGEMLGVASSHGLMALNSGP